MKAAEVTLQGTLTAQQQYVIPIFQRYYAWDTPQWQDLWADITELHEKPGKRHFMGSLVFVPYRAPVSYSYPVYQVIDGQQRVLTFSLLFAALRDLCTENGHTALAEEITFSTLLHQYKQNHERFRVYPRQRDREDFINAAIGKAPAANRVGKALRFFKNEIKDMVDAASADALRGFYLFLLGGLEFVHINLGEENPYKIFRSLNSTGVPLSPADLIRNFVFMSVPLDKQDEFDIELWTPLEAHFLNGKKEVDARQVSAFFRDFLLTQGQYITPDDTFDEFEKRYRDNLNAPDLARELLTYAELYDSLRGVVSYPNPEVADSLLKLRELDSSTAYSLVLRLLKHTKDGRITDGQLVEAVELIVGFVFRRYICGDTSRAYARWFVSACKVIDEPDPVHALEAFLAEKGFPNDDRFEAALVTAPLYSGKYCLPVLQRLERSFGHHEMPDLDEPTIEHVMPQTLSDEWQHDLGPEAARIHEQWLDTLGNLTLTGYNTGLSNHPYSVKLAGINQTVGYNGSNFELTRMVANQSKWGEEEIKARGQELAERAADIWVGTSIESAEAGIVPEDAPANPFGQTGTRWRLFTILVDGQWHSIQTIQDQFSWDVPYRVERLRIIGAKTGTWKIEQDGNKVRMVWPGDPVVSSTGSGEVSEHRQLQLRFWTTFREYMEKNNSPVTCQKPGPRHWMNHALGKSGIHLASAVSIWNSVSGDRTPEVRVALIINTDNSKAQFAALEKMKAQVETALGYPLIWENRPETKSCAVYVQKNANFLDEKLWPQQQQWLKEKLEQFRTVFAPLAHKLDGETTQVAATKTT